MFLFKNREIVGLAGTFKDRKKNWNQVYFSTLSVSIVINRSFLGGCSRFIGYLMPAYSFFARLDKKYVIWWRFAKNGIFPRNILSV